MSPTPKKPTETDDRLDRLEAAVAQLASDFYAVAGSSARLAAAANPALAALIAMHRQDEPQFGAPLPRWGGV